MHYPVMESFYSLQGEGVHGGKPAFFIRLAGCDVGCSWCDVKESWDTKGHPVLETEQLVDQAVHSGAEIVVITGGEPLMYDLDELTSKLQLVGLKTHLETSAAYRLTGCWDWVCVSPKKFKQPLTESLNRADELKVIVVNNKDFAWAASFRSELKDDCQLIVQPEWSKREKVLPAIISFVKDNPEWRVSLQQHKYMNIP